MDGWKKNLNVANFTLSMHNESVQIVFQIKCSLQLGIIFMEFAIFVGWSIYLLEGFWLILSTTHVRVALNKITDLTFSQIVIVLDAKKALHVEKWDMMCETQQLHIVVNYPNNYYEGARWIFYFFIVLY